MKEQPAIKESRENVAAARYNIGVARAAYLPQVNFVTETCSTGNAYPPVIPSTSSTSPTGTGTAGGLGGARGDQFLSLSVSATQLIYDFGKTPGLIDETRASLASRSKITPATGNRWCWTPAPPISAIWQPSGPEGPGRNGAADQAVLKQAQGFYQVGLKAKIDVTKAEANLYDAEANLIKAKNAVDLSRVTLMTALGLKTWPFTQVEDVLEVKAQPQSWKR